MSCTLPEDVVIDILQYLWVLHSTSWDSEFRQESHRRFFADYSLISSVWTAPAQRYVFRSAHLTWSLQVSSFELALRLGEPSGRTRRARVYKILKPNLKGPRSGFLRQCVRVLDVSIAHSKLSVSLSKFDRLLRLTPSLIELRLRIGPELNSLFVYEKQERRLRDAFQSIKPTLRALQVHINSHRKLNRCIKDLQSMITFSDLDFFSITSNQTELNPFPVREKDLARDQFPELDWDIANVEWTSTHWPIETNAATLSLSRILSPLPPPDAIEKPTVLPQSLRLNDEFCSVHGSTITPFLRTLGPHIKEILFQPIFGRWDWEASTVHVIAHCPQLERAALLHADSGYGPKVLMHVLEAEDWAVPEKDAEDASPSADNTEDMTNFIDDSEAAEGQVDTSKVCLKLDGSMILRASHVVAFHEEFTKSCKSKQLEYATHRREPVLDPRLVVEALTGTPDLRNVDSSANVSGFAWTHQVARHNYYFTAVRKPKEVLVVADE
ncbi:hypothetical protein FRC17_005100 [Serendipita sp. 399]|nr:hypothetical protein FRC17_005100 [Serendipita sp. 399]